MTCFKKYLIFLIFVAGISLFSSVAFVSATQLDTCNQSLNNPDYSLTKNITANLDICFNFNSSNIVFDCKGYTIEGASTMSTAFKIFNSHNITIKNCKIENFALISIEIEKSQNNTLENISIKDTSNGIWGTGIYLKELKYSFFRNIKVESSYIDGIEILSSRNNYFADSILSSNYEAGIYLEDSSHNIFKNLTIQDTNLDGFLLSDLGGGATNNTIFDSKIINNGDGVISAGITIDYSQGNIFYNNLFNNSLNFVYFIDPDFENLWNNSDTGNFWAKPDQTGFSETCQDNNKNGICDSAYIIDPFNIDYFPLTSNTVVSFPIFVDIKESPSSPITYSESGIYEFNITWTADSGIDSVGMEFNGINYTDAPNISSKYSKSFISLQAGNYSYYWWANDTDGKFNLTEIKIYTVNKSPQTAMININQSSPITYGDYINVSCNGELYKNDINVPSQNSKSVLLGAGTYNYSCQLQENENYLYNDDNSTLVVNKNFPELYLYLNDSGNNLSVYKNQNFKINSTLVKGEGNISVYANGSLIYQGYLEYHSLLNFSGPGIMNISSIYTETQNYTSSSKTLWVNVTDNPYNQGPLIDINTPKSIIYSTETIELNFSVSDVIGIDKCWYNLNNGNNLTIPNCQNMTFNVSNEGNYIISVFSNNSLGKQGNNSVNFSIDLTGVSITISEPLGIKNSKTGIPLEFSAIGNNLNCWYNVKTSYGIEVTENRTLMSCSNSSFDVPAEGNFILYVYSSNAFGTTNYSSSGFSVSTSSGSSSVPSSSGGSSGGGSGGLVGPQIITSSQSTDQTDSGFETKSESAKDIKEQENPIKKITGKTISEDKKELNIKALIIFLATTLVIIVIFFFIRKKYY